MIWRREYPEFSGRAAHRGVIYPGIDTKDVQLGGGVDPPSCQLSRMLQNFTAHREEHGVAVSVMTVVACNPRRLDQSPTTGRYRVPPDGETGNERNSEGDET
jgi:hypothetical protein